MTKRKKIFIIAIVLISVFCVFLNQAQAAGNTRGWAWSENIGWISFNCDNQGTCGTIDYGVNIDEGTGEFSGWAWSENVGWINFNNPPPYELTNFPGEPFHSATLDVDQTCDGFDRYVTGWAQVYNTGGWIKMSNGVLYGVKRVDKTENLTDLTGYAWSEDFGWISFNCNNESCSGAPYKVITFTPTYAPSATDLSVSQDNCTNNGLYPQVNLSWIFKDCNDSDQQTAYKIQIDDENQFLNPITIEKTKETPNEFYFTITEGDNSLEYGITAKKDYYWRVMVKGNDIWSGWSEVSSFSTPSHPYPEAILECLKDGEDYRPCENLNVSAGEKIYFKGNDIPEICGGLSNLPQELQDVCKNISIQERTWGFGVSCSSPSNCLTGEDCVDNICSKVIPPGDPKENTISRIYSAGPIPEESLSLKITDSSNYSCSASGSFKNNKVNFPLPIWKEVIPKD